MTMRTLVLAALVLCPATVSWAQTKVDVREAELSVPFGTASGTAVLVGDYLVFVDEKEQESSFAIPRVDVKGSERNGNSLTIETKRPIRDRSGERSQFNFRLSGGDMAPFTSWSEMKSTQTSSSKSSSGSSTGGQQNPGRMSFPAEYTQLIGRNSHGNLIVTDEMLAYESVDRVDTSRRWQLKEIKQIKLKNPYEIEIEPFDGDSYTFKLQGKGMDNSEFKQIVDRITSARISR
jgi:hypothetical protein